MADIFFDGFDDLERMFGKLADFPKPVIKEMLEAQESVIVPAQRAAAPKRTGKLAGSIAGDPVVLSFDGGRKDIYPKGVHHTSAKSRYRGGGGGSRAVTNAEVGFIHEYGAPKRHIRARQWMQQANDKATDQAVEKSAEVLNKYIDSL